MDGFEMSDQSNFLYNLRHGEPGGGRFDAIGQRHPLRPRGREPSRMPLTMMEGYRLIEERKRKERQVGILDEELTVGGGGVPVGTYEAELTNIIDESDESKDHVRKYGPSFIWEFTVRGGPNDGETASTMTTQRLTPSTNAGKLAGCLRGKDLQPGEKISLVSLLGARGRIRVVEHKEFTRVDGFKRNGVESKDVPEDIPF